MKGDELQRLSTGAEREVRGNIPFLKGAPGAEYLPEDDLAEYVEPLSFTGEDETGGPDLESLGETLQQIVEEYPQGDGMMDTEAAVAVREHIDLSRSQAADSGIWHDLSIRKFPWFVRHRWGFESETAMKKKFWTHGVALDSQSCTFERLWWIAELTRRPCKDDPYLYTRRALSSRRFVFRVFDIKMGRYMPAVFALVDVLFDEDKDDDTDLGGGFVGNKIIDEVVQRFRKSGAAMPFEGRDKTAIVDALMEIRNDVEE